MARVKTKQEPLMEELLKDCLDSKGGLWGKTGCPSNSRITYSETGLSPWHALWG